MSLFAEGANPEFLRSRIIGGDAEYRTPFGMRRMLYADYTASGRALDFVEESVSRLLATYANSHTEDDVSGRTMTRLLNQARARIKRHVNAGAHGQVVGVGTGATGAIQKMQQIIGVALPPVTRQNLEGLMQGCLGADAVMSFREFCQAHQPVVFVGPYEHHSNEVSWREGLATVVEVALGEDGDIDLAHLEDLLKMPEYQGRLRIGSFSAASNVTGLRSNVKEIAVLLHRHQALAFFDYAASAPYVTIDMNPVSTESAADPSIDAIFVSAHKFLGGPGASGILVFNERCYQRHLPPTVAGGGTVDFVGPRDHVFVGDIETREQAGTPGILQIIRAALAFEVKHAVGEDVIEAREARFTRQAFSNWSRESGIEILGNQDPSRRIGIISFNIRDGQSSYLHPRFVTTLLDDLFGIQSRAGCSCAGPYGHALLGIDDRTAARYRRLIVEGMNGIKPGWCRVGLHYAFDDAEAAHLIECVTFVARHGSRFLPLYRFDPVSGAWWHSLRPEVECDEFPALLQGWTALGDSRPDVARRRACYRESLDAAREWLDRLPATDRHNVVRLPGDAGDLQYFRLLEQNLVDSTEPYRVRRLA